ncbi:hypothetical protein GLP59_13580 [Sulfitobacter sp. M220]|nr:hypothetical protein [Sulfitobacter sp. M22]MCF7778664.1 hypothetical protein [Sulfitobacter sp. M220]
MELGTSGYREQSSCISCGINGAVTLIQTCKLNSVDPQAYLADTVTAIVVGHKQSQINDLLQWNYAK